VFVVRLNPELNAKRLYPCTNSTDVPNLAVLKCFTRMPKDQLAASISQTAQALDVAVCNSILIVMTHWQKNKNKRSALSFL